MRLLLGFLVILAIPVAASAQTCGTGGPPFAVAPGSVNITLRAGQTLKGTVLCVDREKLVMSDGARVRLVPLAHVLRIVKPRDSILNGFAIGAGIGLFVGANGGEATYFDGSESKFMLQAALVLGGIGAAIDALNGSSWTVYTAPSTASKNVGFQWRTRF